MRNFGFLLAWCAMLSSAAISAAADPTAEEFKAVRALVARYCGECHQGAEAEAELDLVAFGDLAACRSNVAAWQKVAEMLDSGQMPPDDAPQPSDAERDLLADFVRRFLQEEARRTAGDPGPGTLRRLNNAEYTYVIRDLTGVEQLSPAAEFPADGAAGEGFTNAAAALAMSPALVEKYLDAAKRIAEHAVLLPDGLRFSASTTRRDWTEELLAEIRALYARYSDSGGATQVNLQGVVFETNGGGRLPLDRYLAALISERQALAEGKRDYAQIASDRRLSPKYLQRLHETLKAPSSSLLLERIQRRFAHATPEEVAELVAEIARWQQALWKFSSVGHIGKVGGPKAWMEPVDPVAARQELRLELPPPDADGVVTVYLAAGDAGDGSEHDFALWERPRLVSPGRVDLPLADLRRLSSLLLSRRQRIVAQAAKALRAADEASRASGAIDVAALAKRHEVDLDVLAAWLEYLGVEAGGADPIAAPLTRQTTGVGGYDFVRGWVGDDALSVVANSSDQEVRIPGRMPPHRVAVHPSPSRQAAIGWRSPRDATLAIAGRIQAAHAECGNGVTWSLELRRGATRQALASGGSRGADEVPFGPLEGVTVRTGDVVVLSVHPRDVDHSCDLTLVDLTLRDASGQWDLAREVSDDILAANPHADGQGAEGVWHFFSEPVAGPGGVLVPAGSLLARWQSADEGAPRAALAEELQRLLETPEAAAADSPDGILRSQLLALGGPLQTAALSALDASAPADGSFGLPAERFGRRPDGSAIEPASLCVRAPEVIEVRIPAELAAGAALVTSATLDPELGREGSVQMQLASSRPEAADGLQAAGAHETQGAGPWTSNLRQVSFSAPILTAEGSQARQRFLAAFADFRELFPAALCYSKIVPVDEVITLTLFHREDEPLSRLVLSESEAAELDRLWSELRFVSQDALTLQDAFEQLWQFATQDADPSAFEPLREPIRQRALEFRKQLLDAEPAHVESVVRLAERAYRRPLAEGEADELRQLYAGLRSQDLPHESAVRLLIARVLVSPAFLYRLERGPQIGPTAEAVSKASSPVRVAPLSDWELASRLSFFLTSSSPDEELRRAASEGRLTDPDSLAAEAARLRRGPAARRLATEFGCQWLHVYEFSSHDEKSEATFPSFAGLRGFMHEEVIAFLTDWLQRDGSILELLDADHTFVNGELAAHYGLEGIESGEFRRVDGQRAAGRGGLLAWSATLSKQSGASRTSAILRGNWICEVLLGEKLPKPPAGVPPLPEELPQGLTERQLIERHTRDAACAKCHRRIDPYGFALEGFDAIGRGRSGAEVDTRVRLPDGTEVDGLAGLREYLVTKRSDDFLRQFYRKLLGYALGRAVQLSDQPLIDEMLADGAAHDYRVGVAIDRIVRSPQFRMRRVDEFDDTENADAQGPPPKVSGLAPLSTEVSLP